MDINPEVLIYGIIGDDALEMVSARRVVSQLAAVRNKGVAPVVRINSIGGDVNEALAIHNAIQRYDASVVIDGLAASAASYISSAGRSVKIARNGMIMIHRPGAINLSWDDFERYRKISDVLFKYTRLLAEGYAERMRRPVDEVLELMKQETWFDAAEARQWGLVDAIENRDGELPMLPRDLFEKTPAHLVDNQLTVKDLMNKARLLAWKVGKP